MSFRLPAEKNKPEFPDLFSNNPDKSHQKKTFFPNSSYMGPSFDNQHKPSIKFISKKSLISSISEKKNFIVSSKRLIGQLPDTDPITPIKNLGPSQFRPLPDFNVYFENNEWYPAF